MQPEDKSTYQDTIDKLILLSNLKPGYTLSVVDNFCIVEHNLITAWYRRWYQEDRNKTIGAIGLVIKEAESCLNGFKFNQLAIRFLFCTYLKGARKGIESLLETYRDDVAIKAKIITILDAIDRLLSKYPPFLGANWPFRHTPLNNIVIFPIYPKEDKVIL